MANGHKDQRGSTRFLLDASILIAILDRLHIHHERSLTWFLEDDQRAWLTCTMTENGYVRIVSHRSYANPTPTPAVAIQKLRVLTRVGNHQYIPDDVSILDDDVFIYDHVLSHGQITDTYLLGLATRHDAVLATLDRRLVTSVVRTQGARVHLI